MEETVHRNMEVAYNKFNSLIKNSFKGIYLGIGGQGGAVVFKASDKMSLKKIWKQAPDKRVSWNVLKFYYPSSFNLRLWQQMEKTLQKLD